MLTFRSFSNDLLHRPKKLLSQPKENEIIHANVCLLCETAADVMIYKHITRGDYLTSIAQALQNTSRKSIDEEHWFSTTENIIFLVNVELLTDGTDKCENLEMLMGVPSLLFLHYWITGDGTVWYRCSLFGRVLPIVSRELFLCPLDKVCLIECL